MKYRTIIELICDAADTEDASNIAGDYLKGDMDFGVEMISRTTSLRAHKVKKCMASGMAVMLMFSAFLLKTFPLGGGAESRVALSNRFNNTCTVMPELKTQQKTRFREQWEDKKDQATLDFLKE